MRSINEEGRLIPNMTPSVQEVKDIKKYTFNDEILKGIMRFKGYKGIDKETGVYSKFDSNTDTVYQRYNKKRIRTTQNWRGYYYTHR